MPSPSFPVFFLERIALPKTSHSAVSVSTDIDIAKFDDAVKDHVEILIYAAHCEPL